MAKILIVDDSDEIRSMLGLTLRHFGHDVTETINGQEGLGAVTTEKFDLVISDIDMPVMNGFEFIEKMRGDLGADAPPVIVLSAERDEIRERALTLGAAEIMVKPFKPLEFADVIKRYVPGA